MLVAEEDGGELDQLDEHKHDAGDHPHVQAGHVRHSGNRSIKDFVSNEKLKFLKVDTILNNVFCFTTFSHWQTWM